MRPEIREIKVSNVFFRFYEFYRKDCIHRIEKKPLSILLI